MAGWPSSVSFFARTFSHTSYLAQSTMLTKVKKTIAEHDLIKQGDSILVGLSGGPDSVALLHVLCKLRRSMELQLDAVYINHGIRPKAALREEAFCRRLCKKLKVDLTIVREDVPVIARRHKKGIEETARDVRYCIYDELADSMGCDKIALGHHADDNIETILFRILRGTGRTGLLGIPIRRGRIIRPLLQSTKKEILDYLKKEKLHFCLDESNVSDEYSRNYLRNRLLPDIRKRLNPAVDSALLNLADTLAAEESFLAEYTSVRTKKMLNRTVGGKNELDLTIFRMYDVWLRRRVLRHCIADCLRLGAMPGKQVIDRLDRLAIDGGRAISLPGHLQAELVNDKLVVYRKVKISYCERLAPGQPCRLERPRLTLRCRQRPMSEVKVTRERRARTVLMDLAKLSPPLVVRNIRPGDRFRPLGMSGSRKIADYLIDRKVGRVYRDEIPLVCDKKGIIWLVGFEIADRVKVDRSTKEVLKVEVVRRRGKAVAAF